MAKTLAKGKDAVLQLIKEIAERRCGKEGAYRAIGDESGIDILIISGQTFSGLHEVQASSSDIRQFRTEKGIIVEIEDSE